MFNFFQSTPNSHLRRAMELLREANLARIEHQAAAEHHGALAKMYAERAARLEREVYEAMPLVEGMSGAARGKELEERPVLYALDAANRRLDAQAKA